VPLVEQDRLIAALGVTLGRAPDPVDRELLRLFRLELTAACANVQLHREAAKVLTMAKELDLAGAIRLALSPDVRDGAVGPLEWAGHHEAAGDAGSDFWGVYPIDTGRVMVVVGDAVGSGLGGTMVSAVIKSCCDAVFDGAPELVPPAELLAILTAALFRPGAKPAHARCLAMLFEVEARRVTYASAGIPAPYRIVLEDGAGTIGTLAGAGPMLGDAAEVYFRESRTPLGERELFLLYTDGLVRAPGADGRPFGDRRLQRVLAHPGGGAPRELRDGILAAHEAFRAGARLGDDLALVVIRVT
jgi:sigma-B regulation protein RsbU (phosphoserine phosphatase)